MDRRKILTFRKGVESGWSVRLSDSMSATEIMAELPKLTKDEQAAVWRRLQELEVVRDEELRFRDALLLTAMADLDRREAAHD